VNSDENAGGQPRGLTIGVVLGHVPALPAASSALAQARALPAA
jgi:hypothetical protein